MNKYRNRVVMAAAAAALLMASARAHEVAVSYPSVMLIGHTASVRAVAFSPDGKTLASAGGQSQINQPDDRTVRIWNLTKGE